VPWESITPLTATGTWRKTTRKVVKLLGMGGQLAMSVHNNCVANALRAVRERVFAVEVNHKLEQPPRPMGDRFAVRMREFREEVLEHVDPCTPWTIQQFVGSYTGSKFKRYSLAAASLASRGVSKADAYLQSFVKAEAVNQTAKPDPAPRIIQPRNPRYNVMVGKYLRPLEHLMYRAIAKVFGGPTVMKGLNAVTTARAIVDMWREFNDPVCVSLDASRFDQHVSRKALEWEHGVYNSIYQSQELAGLLRWQLRNKGFVRCADGAFSYEVEGCRMSGDMNTSLGNCLIMCGLVWSYARKRGVPIRLANNGDDCAVIMDRKHLGQFTNGLDKWFRQMGFNMKVEGVATRLEGIEFCQTRPVFTYTGWRMCRSPHIAPSKDVMWKTPDHGNLVVSYRKWLHAVGTAGGAIADGVPIFSAMYCAMRRVGIKASKVQGFGDMSSGFEFMAKGLTDYGMPITDEARVSFWRAWGVPPDLQVELEQTYASGWGSWEVVQLMSSADNSGIRTVCNHGEEED
jgi:hypothetical protein